MPIDIETSSGVDYVSEKSNPGIEVAFTDSDGDAVTPSALKWSLSDGAGNIINSRDEVDYDGVLATSVILVLTENDTTLQDFESVPGTKYARYISFEWTYDSDELGNNAIGRDEGIFYIENLRSE